VIFAPDGRTIPFMDDSLHASRSSARPIVLIGMMGAGKTTLGRALAHALGREFVDLDARIEMEGGRTISKIFAEDGEPIFRAVEFAALLQCLQTDPRIVLATGGGAACSESAWEALEESADVVWLDASIDVLLARTGTASGRPLLDGVSDPRAVLGELLALRRSWYARAAIRIPMDESSPDAGLSELLRHFGEETP